MSNTKEKLNNNINNDVKHSIGDFLIAMLLSGKSIKNFYAIIHEREMARFKKESVRSSLSRLDRKGYLNKTEEGWLLTSSGKTYAERKFLLSYLPSPFNNKSPSNTIISFDIPGPQRHLRDWLRNQIKIYNYKMIHQSLWLGPGPLPKNFLKKLNQLKIRKNIKIFAVKKK